MENYWRLNKVDQNHLEKRIRRKKNGKTIAAILLTTLGIFLDYYFIPQVNLHTCIFIDLEGNIPPHITDSHKGFDVFKVGGEPALVSNYSLLPVYGA